VEPVTEPTLAVTVAEPNPTATTRPVELVEMILKLLLFQAALRVRSCVEPSENLPVAASCTPLPCTNSTGLAGVIVMV
jgi:hypothetical protein